MEIFDFVRSLNVSLPSEERFIELGDATALKSGGDGTFIRSNYERGILLYSLVAHFKPTTVMEFGTGRGYGTLCVAWAMDDYNIPGNVYTIDYLKPETTMSWPIKRQDQNPGVESLSWNEVWPEITPQSWRDRIKHLTGKSQDALRHYSGPPIDFAFIDGGHDYNAVRHDFYATLLRTAPTFHILFDDYEDENRYGVSKLIRDEIIPNFETHFFSTCNRSLQNWQQRDKRAYQMIWIHSDSLEKPLRETFSFTALRNNIVKDRYRTRIQRWITFYKTKLAKMRRPNNSTTQE